MKLHLGCGQKMIKGWKHVDVMPYPHIDLQCEVDSMPMIKSDSAEVVYACHVLEHFHRKDTDRVLAEWRRVLTPGGTLRLAVPDFAAIAEVYAKVGDLDAVHGLVFGRQDYLYNIHHTVFDFRTLEAHLRGTGFSDIRRYDWRQTEHAFVDDFSQAYFPHMDKANGRLMSLNVEATKP